MKIFKDGIYASLDVVFAPLFLVIATPFFIYKLGIDNYGLWVLINSIVASLSLFNFGINETVIKYVALYKKEKNLLQQQKVFSSIVSFQVLMAIAAMVVMLLLFVINKIGSPKDLNQIILILLFAVPLFFIRQIEQALFALHKAYEDFKYMVKQSFVSKLLFYSSQLLAVFLYESVLSIFQLSVTVSFIYLCIQFYLLKSKYNNIFSLKLASKDTFKSVFKGYGKWAWLSSTASIVNSNIDKWFVSASLGLTVFGYYSLGVLILNQLHTIISASISWIFPKISSNELEEKTQIKFHLNLTLFVSLIGLLASLMLVNMDFLFIAWLGEETFSNSRTFIHVFLYLLPVWLMSSVSYYYLLGLGAVKQKFYLDIIVLSIKVGLLYIILILIKQDNSTWPIYYLIPIFAEIILYTIILYKKIKLKLFYLFLLAFFNVMLLVFRYF
ncbi:hypothetical protein BFP78_03260 [Gaetbulibacter sp. 5U11]|nr:hypothetical protein BFP78_03260 [Gaetbulibacter sp. 5U11]